MTSTSNSPSNPTQQQLPSSTAAAPSSTPQPQQGTTSKPPSGPIGPAAAPAASRPVSYAHAATKTTFQPQSAPQSPSVPKQPQNARNPSNPSPVNGQKVPPAVPSVIPPVINGGANGQHSRKTSVAGVNVGGNRPPQNGGPNMPHRPTPAGQGSIQFGSLGSGGGSPAIGVASLAAPAGASNPVGSPAMASATVASGGAPQSAPAHNIQFGSFQQEGNPNQGRPMSINGPPHMPTGPQGQHARRDSNHSTHGEHLPSGMGPARGGMANSGGRRGGHQQMYNQGGHHQQNYQHQQGPYGPYNQNPQFNRGAPNQPRGGPVGMSVNHQYQHPQPSPNMSYSNRASRSPAIPQSSPMTTPQMAQAQMVQQPMTPFQQYPQHMGGPMPHHQQQFPPFQQFPPEFVPSFYPHPPNATSPRPGYSMPSPGPAFAQIYPQPGAAPMSRSGSVNTIGDIHRPSSALNMPQNIPPQLQNAPVPGPASPVPNRTLFQPPSKAKSTLVIRNPTTQEIISPVKVAESPRQSTGPVVVSSGGSRTPQHDRQPSRSNEDDQKKKDAARAAVQRRIEEEKEKRRLEEEEAQKKKEEEERAAKEAEERKAKEEAEAKAKEEAELKAKEEAERKAKEEEERLAKEAEEKAAAAKEAEEKAAKEAEEKAAKEAEEKLAKEKAEKEAEEKAAKEAEEAKTKAEPEPVAEEKEAAEDKSAGATGEMPPPTTKIRTAKPPPLKLPLGNTSEPPLQSAALTSLRSARFIEDISGVNYPSGILSPNPALNPNASHGKFKYDKEFLLQFQGVFTEKPSVDWDNRIRDTVGEPDSARPQTARLQSSGGRRGMPSTPMGTFGSGNKFPISGSGARTPLTSEERFQASNRQLGLNNPFGMGIMKSTPMSRSGSAQSSSSYVPSSPKTGGRSGTSRGTDRKRGSGAPDMQRQQSRRDEEPKPIVTIPLSEVKPLVISASRWTPRSLTATAAPVAAAPAAGPEDNLMTPEMVQRKVKAALNKMTPEKFDKIADQILEIAGQSKFETDGRTLRQVIQLTFEKATDEAAWSSMYAKFCKRMLESIDPSISDENIKDKHGNVVTGGALFRKYLLNRCQEEFERGWKVNLPPKPEGESEEAVMLSDEYYIMAAAKRRGLGLIQFIGELFKLGMLTERIMHECVKKLVDFEGIPEEEEAESLVKLLKTIGESLDSLPKSKPAMDAYFHRIKYIEEMKGLPSRIKFMLMDIIDLRNKGWQTKEADKGPKTIAEIHEEAARVQAEKEAQNKASRQARPQGRGNDRNFSYNQQHQPDWQGNVKAQVDTGELKKLQSKHRSMGTTPPSFGPPSFFTRPGANRKPMGGRGGEDSASNSRSGTPAPKESANKYSVLEQEGTDHNEASSPPASTTSSPPVVKAKLGDLS